MATSAVERLSASSSSSVGSQVAVARQTQLTTLWCCCLGLQTLDQSTSLTSCAISPALQVTASTKAVHQPMLMSKR